MHPKTSKPSKIAPASSIDRRGVLKGSAAAAALATGTLGFPYIARAKPDTIVVSDAGGALNEAYRAAYYDPFTEATGIRVSNAPYAGLGKIEAMVTNNNVTEHVADIDATEAALAGLKGLLEPIDYDVIDKSTLLPEAAKEFYVLADIAAYVVTFNTDQDQHPADWSEVWSMPGRKSLWKLASQTLEVALMADGVAKEDLYPIDLERALASLNKIRDQITWWESGAQGAQLIIDGETDMGATWNGRVHQPKLDGAPVDFHFNQALLVADALVVPRGVPDKEWAMQMVATFLDAKNQSVFSTKIPYGPVVPAALDMLDDATLATLPTGPENYPKTVFQDFDYWAENGDTLYGTFNEWLAG
jgi:putative spermidine/putrescine transport system substrate-binding protein